MEGVEFTGRVEQQVMATLFDEADVFLNTSRVDNMPVSIIEAYYSGLPVVTTDAGGIACMVEDGVSGLVRPIADDAALAQAVLSVLRDTDLRGRLVAGGRELAAGYSWSRVGPAWAALYRRVCG